MTISDNIAGIAVFYWEMKFTGGILMKDDVAYNYVTQLRLEMEEEMNKMREEIRKIKEQMVRK
jgi:hypothetical protein